MWTMNFRNWQKNDSTVDRLEAIHLPVFEETDNMSRDSNPSLIILTYHKSLFNWSVHG